jgi:hypothetical protein
MKCRTFLEHPNLLTAPYKVQSAVAIPSFEHFIEVIEDSTPHITASNASDLSLLCDEFGFADLAQQVSAFDPDLTAVQDTKRLLPEDIRHLFDELDCHVHALEKRRDELILLMARTLGGGTKRVMQIFVKNLSNKKFVLDVSPGDRVEDIKAKLEAAEGTSQAAMTLVWEGKFISDGNTLESYGIESGATVYMVGSG